MVRVREARRAFKRHRPEEVARLDLVAPFDRVEAKAKWLAARDDADGCARDRLTKSGVSMGLFDLISLTGN